VSEQPTFSGIVQGFGPDTVAGLTEAYQAAQHFMLLRGLTSGGREDFLLRFGVIADLVHADQTLWTLDALERRLIWLDEERILSTLRVLRRSGWMEMVGTGYRLTSDGLAVYATLARLSSLHNGRDDSLAMGVFDLEASTQLGEDTGPALRHLQHHLRRAVEDVESAVKSQSEVKVLDAREALDKNLEWSQRARLLLDRIDISDDQGYRTGQRLGKDLAELHRWHSVMQRVLDEVGKSHVPVGALGLRPSDIDRFLGALSIDELVALGGDFVSSPVWPRVLLTDNLLDVASYELIYAERTEHETVGWQDGDAESAEVGEPPPSPGEVAFKGYEHDLRQLLTRDEKTPLERFLVSRDFPRTCYRMTLLALEDESPDSEVELHIVPGKSRAVFTDYVSEISEGTLEPKRAAIASNSTSEDEDVQEQADSKDEIE
jgi:hypothetical protein